MELFEVQFFNDYLHISSPRSRNTQKIHVVKDALAWLQSARVLIATVCSSDCLFDYISEHFNNFSPSPYIKTQLHHWCMTYGYIRFVILDLYMYVYSYMGLQRCIFPRYNVHPDTVVTI